MKRIDHSFGIVLILLLFECSCNRIVSNSSSGKTINGNYQILNTTKIENNDSSSFVYGFIEDAFTKTKINGAIISLDGSDLYYMSNNSFGTFYLHIPPGTYQLKVENAGNTTLITQKITFKPNQKYEIIFSLGTTIIY